jgi:hypothetical protein
MSKLRTSLLALSALCASAGWAQALPLNTVSWDGGTTGTLGSIVVTYTTTTPPGWSTGYTIPEVWTTSLATSSVATTVTSETGGVIGGSVSGAIQTITFSAAVVNPILLFNYTIDGETFDFGSATVTFLSGHNAALAGDLLTFVGSGNTSNDGAALQLTGTYGPSNPLTFVYTYVGNADTVGFTVATVPEPGALGLLAVGAVGLIAARRRPRQTAAMV